MSFARYAHNGADAAVPPGLQQDAEAALCVASADVGNNRATAFRLSVAREMFLRGWSDRVPVAIRQSKLTISSIKERTGLCVQFGNFARVYADLLKLEALRRAGHINSAILVVLDDELARRLGSNLARFERVERELKVFHSVLECPILLLGLQSVHGIGGSDGGLG